MKFTFDTDNNTISYDTSSAPLNNYLLGLNGAYQGANWKLLANNRDNFLTTYNKKNNIIQTAGFSEVQDKVYIDSGSNLESVETFYDKTYTINSFKEPPVEYNLPMRHVLNVDRAEEDIEILSSYNNLKDSFANKHLKDSLKYEVEDTETIYDKLEKPINGINVKEVEHVDYIFPKKELVGLKEIRLKPNFNETTGSSTALIQTGYDQNTAYIRKIWGEAIAYVDTKLAKSSKISRNTTNAFETPTGIGSVNALNFPQKRPDEYTLSKNKYIEIGKNSYETTRLQFYIDDRHKSIWPLDSFLQPTGYPEFSFIQILEHKYGDLAPMTEVEAVYFLRATTGSLNINYITQSNQLIKSYLTFNYGRNVNRIAPRGQFVYLNFGEQEGKNKYYNFGIRYKTDKLTYNSLYQTGQYNSPWYESYEEYSEDVNTKIYKNYTFVPEYCISDHIPYFVTGNNGVFAKPSSEEYLKLYWTNFSNYSFFTSSDALNNFILNSEFDKNKKIKIKVNAVKKLLPYNGFYPQQQSVKIIELFQKSFFGFDTYDALYKDFALVSGSEGGGSLYAGSVGNDPTISKLTGAVIAGAHLDHQVATIIQPYFAPGILFNTIKSSIAMSWPTFITKSLGYSQPFGIGESWETDGLIYESFNHIFKFEDLLTINDAIPSNLKNSENNQNYLRYLASNYNPRSAGTIVPEYKISYEFNSFNKDWTEKNSLYRLGIHNFLAEIPNFFLKNGKLNNFLSKPQKFFGSVVSGTTYYMDVVLERHPDQKQFLDRKVEGTSGSTYYLTEESFYGPRPSTIFSNTISFQSSSLVYSPFAPPYSYGKAIARLSYKPDFSGKVSLTDIFSQLKISYINEKQESDFSILNNSLPSNLKPVTGLNIYRSRMDLSSSINFFQKTNLSNLKYDEFGNPIDVQESADDSNNVWSIQTKFETPLLNFNTEKNLNEVNGSSLYTQQLFNESGTGFENISFVSTLGLWSGYGSVPENGKGINFSIQESFPVGNGVGSLIDLCGFSVSQKNIGLIAERKKISEAVVLIPYIELGEENFQDNKIAKNIPGIVGENGIDINTRTTKGPFYFYLDETKINKVLDCEFKNTTIEQLQKLLQRTNIDKNNSIVKTIKLMQEYNLPPHLNWVYNKSIDPFVMYIFEFNDELDQDDLSNIWQGLMPKVARIAKQDSVTIEHALTEEEFFHGKELPKNVKFKIFKIKKRASINYYDLTDDSSDDTRFRFDFANSSKPFYSYNWPYDYFSLVELVNIEAGGIVTSGSI